MLRLPRRVGARFVALVRADPAGVRAGFVALLVSSATGLVAGLTLGAITDTLQEHRGLLVLVPAAIGMRGNVFGALSSRLGTAIHVGTFRPTLRRGSFLYGNVAAAFTLSIAGAVGLAVIAKLATVAFDVEGAISLTDFLVVSVVASAISSVVLAAITVRIARASTRHDWDLDNVAAPLVTSTGDVVTLPSVWLATLLLGLAVFTPTAALVCLLAAAALLAVALRGRATLTSRIVRESLPVLLLAGAVDVLAGLTVEKRLGSFADFPALLVLVPPFLGQSGSLGGILVSRLSTRLHLGTLAADRFSLRRIADDIGLLVIYALPVYLLVGVSADLVAALAGLRGPGSLDVVLVALLAGSVTTALIVVIAYAAALLSYRLGLDPDNHGIPLVTSTLDLVGVVALILVIVLLGLG